MPNKEAASFTYNLSEISGAAGWVIQEARGAKLWCFNGQMGSGKTTLITAICRKLGVVGEVNSPSFSIVNEYLTVEGKSVYHFDFYRINTIEEVYDIGFETYFDSGCICLIEWPEKILAILANEPNLQFKIEIAGASRKVTQILHDLG